MRTTPAYYAARSVVAQSTCNLPVTERAVVDGEDGREVESIQEMSTR